MYSKENITTNPIYKKKKLNKWNLKMKNEEIPSIS